MKAGWRQPGDGDWTSDSLFDFDDIFVALGAAYYPTGPYAATPQAGTSTVPEPETLSLTSVAILLMAMSRRRIAVKSVESVVV